MISKKILNFVTIHPKTPLSMNFTYGPLIFWEKIATHNFPKTPQTAIQPTCRPQTFTKKKLSTSHKLTKHPNIIKQSQPLQPPLHTPHCQQENVAESIKDTGLARQCRVPFFSIKPVHIFTVVLFVYSKEWLIKPVHIFMVVLFVYSINVCKSTTTTEISLWNLCDEVHGVLEW
jgi:hypothetical protein